jgi:hypothetical protein
MFISEPVIGVYSNSFIFISGNNPYCYNQNKNFITESNDSCYLFNWKCTPPSIVNIPTTYSEHKIIPFTSHFHTGVHAYSGIFSILYTFLKKEVTLHDYKIAVYKNIQKGILEILYYFFNESDVILLDSNTVYQFSEIKLIPNSLHSFLENHEISLAISDTIMGKIKLNDEINYPKKIAIIKTFDSSVTSTMGAIDKSIAIDYCRTNGFEMIEPSEVGEVALANYINNCEEIIFSWGTTFMKNFIYLSEKAKNAKVFIFGDEFEYEYRNAISRDIIVKRYKNCVFEYKLNEI